MNEHIEIVFMSPNNGYLCVGIPLYQITKEQIPMISSDYNATWDQHTLLAYAMDIGMQNLSLLNADWVHENLINMGEL